MTTFNSYLKHQRVSELISVYFQGKISGKLWISIGFQPIKAFACEMENTSQLETGAWPPSHPMYCMLVIIGYSWTCLYVYIYMWFMYSSNMDYYIVLLQQIVSDYWGMLVCLLITGTLSTSYSCFCLVADHWINYCSSNVNWI